jgi:hypothetical protein
LMLMQTHKLLVVYDVSLRKLNSSKGETTGARDAPQAST